MYIIIVLSDPPIELKQPKSLDYEHMSNVTSIRVQSKPCKCVRSRFGVFFWKLSYKCDWTFTKCWQHSILFLEKKLFSTKAKPHKGQAAPKGTNGKETNKKQDQGKVVLASPFVRF